MIHEGRLTKKLHNALSTIDTDTVYCAGPDVIACWNGTGVCNDPEFNKAISKAVNIDSIEQRGKARINYYTISLKKKTTKKAEQ